MCAWSFCRHARSISSLASSSCPRQREREREGERERERERSGGRGRGGRKGGKGRGREDNDTTLAHAAHTHNQPEVRAKFSLALHTLCVVATHHVSGKFNAPEVGLNNGGLL